MTKGDFINDNQTLSTGANIFSETFSKGLIYMQIAKIVLCIVLELAFGSKSSERFWSYLINLEFPENLLCACYNAGGHAHPSFGQTCALVVLK